MQNFKLARFQKLIKKTKSYRLAQYFAAFLLDSTATQIQAIAIGWSVYAINHRAIDLGLVGLMFFLPALLLVLVTGAIADRFPRKGIVMTASAIKCVGALGFAALFYADIKRLDVTLIVVLILGTARAFGQVAERTMLINIVDPPDYMSTKALYSSIRELIVIGGPALGGILVGISASWAFGAAAAMFAMSICCLVFVHVRNDVRPKDPPSWRSALEGFHFVRSQPVLLGAISLDLFAVLLGGAVALLPIYASDILHVGPFGYGLLRSSIAVGAFASGFYLSRNTPTRHIGASLLWSMAGFGIATVVFAFSTMLWISMAALALIGVFDMINVVIRTGIVQLTTPDDMRGRVSAIEMVFVGASNELGAFESGALAQLIGSVGAVAVGGIATIIIVALWAAWFPALRDSDTLVADVSLTQ